MQYARSRGYILHKGKRRAKAKTDPQCRAYGIVLQIYLGYVVCLKVNNIYRGGQMIYWLGNGAFTK